MVSTAYSTGSWLGIVRSGSVIVLEAQTAPRIVSELWEFLGESPTIHGVLNEVTAQFSTPLTDMPDFAILVQRSRLHAVLRGDLNLVIHSGGHAEEMTGVDVTTWSERSLPLPESLLLTMPQAEEMADEGFFLPVGEAVVLLGSLYMGPTADEDQADEGRSGQNEGEHDGGAAAPPLVPPETESGQEQETVLARWAGAVEEDEQFDEIDTEFALAADAEWTAQLAPVTTPAEPTEGNDPLHEPDPLQHVLPPLPSQPPMVGAPVDVVNDVVEEPEAENAEAGVEDAEQLEPAPPGLEVPVTEHTAVVVDPALEPESVVVSSTDSKSEASPPGVLAAAPEIDPEQAPEPEPVLDTDPEPGTEPEPGAEPEPGLEEESNLAPSDSRPITGPIVVARLCHNGHPNPPYRSSCCDCGATVAGGPCEVRRPRLGAMHISNGDVVDLDQSLIIGRAPSLAGVQGAPVAHLVQVDSEHGDISRSHLEVRLVGWDLLLVDLHATNGTVLVREGQPPRRIGAGEEVLVLNGDVAELGDGVSLFFDGLP